MNMASDQVGVLRACSVDLQIVLDRSSALRAASNRSTMLDLVIPYQDPIKGMFRAFSILLARSI